ncbi:unnamed protein product [Meloidogyne enterolobii]|uniref:Uncharacterized protein n=1 Tax=Meloidogyne enterolobii TaxID=390850 RepID=A0ACB0XQ36_MELEN
MYIQIFFSLFLPFLLFLPLTLTYLTNTTFCQQGKNHTFCQRLCDET